MTEQQLIDIFKKMHGGTANVKVTYKKELTLSKTSKDAKVDPSRFFKVVTRKAMGDMHYYNTEQGRASLAKGNTEKLPAGCDGHIKDADGNEYRYLYTSPKGGRVRFFPSSGWKDDIRYFVDGKEVQYADIEKLVNDDVLDQKALKQYPETDYMCPYISTLINVTLNHKDGSVDVADPNAIKSYDEY